MEKKYIIIIPPNSGMIVEEVKDSSEAMERVHKYCGFDRKYQNAPLPGNCIVYTTTADNHYILPVNLPLTWIIGGGEVDKVRECYFGYGVVCCYNSDGMGTDEYITGFDAIEVHKVMCKLREFIPGRGCY